MYCTIGGNITRNLYAFTLGFPAVQDSSYFHFTRIRILYNLNMALLSHIETIFKETCALTRAAWAGHVSYMDEAWKLNCAYHLSKPREQALQAFLRDKESASWLGGALSAGRVRFRPLNGADEGLRLYTFPLGESSQALCLVASAQALSTTEQRIWKLAALVFRDGLPSARDSQEQTRKLQQAVLELEETQQELQARIAAQREAEARLVQAAKLAAVGEMAAGVAHELNNPLTTVVGFTELTINELSPDSLMRKDLELVLREAHRARSVVRRLLDFSRKSEMVRTHTNLNEIVDDVVALTANLLQTSHVRLQLMMTDALPQVLVDRNQIKQVLINLVNNAIYAMPQGGALRIGTEIRQRYSRDWLCLLVADSGVGIPAENLERIFQPFFTTRGEKGGTGLGLSVTYGIVTEHAGMIEVESEPGHGTVFTVWLPIPVEEIPS